MIIEVLLGAAMGFELLIIGILMIIGGGVGLLTGSVAFGLITVIVLGLLYIFFGRSLVKNQFNIKTTATNVDAIMGKKAMVVKKITESQPGQVKVEGEIWRATASKTIEEQTEVTIESVSGVTLHVHTN